MEFGFTFDATSVPESERPEYVPIPANTRVTLQVIEADIIPTKSGRGLKFICQVVSGPHENRKVRGFINIENASQDCERWGQRELADLCIAMERPAIDSTEDMLYAPFDATLGVKADKTYGPQNFIKRYHKPGETAVKAAPAQQARQPAPAAKPATAQDKPWKTRAA